MAEGAPDPIQAALRAGWLRAYGSGGYARVRDTTVGVAGAGGLGSNAAACLVRSGFRRLWVYDCDRVEPGNLNRQYYFARQVGLPKVEALQENLLAIAPDLEYHAGCLRLTPENLAQAFAPCTVVVEALDGAADKGRLVEELAGTGRLVVAASGLAGWSDPGAMRARRFGAEVVIVGDGESEAGPDAPPLAPRVMAAAAWQASVVLAEVLAGRAGGARA